MTVLLDAAARRRSPKRRTSLSPQATTSWIESHTPAMDEWEERGGRAVASLCCCKFAAA
jgi:hypothetical protein